MAKTLILYDGKLSSTERVAIVCAEVIGHAGLREIGEAPEDLSVYDGFCFIFNFYGALTAGKTKSFMAAHREALAGKRVAFVGLGFSDQGFTRYCVDMESVIGGGQIAGVFISDERRTPEAAYEISRKMRTPIREMDEEKLLRRIEAFIASHKMMSMATGMEGYVRCTPVAYRYAGGIFYVLTEGGYKFRSILNNSHVSCAIFDEPDGSENRRALQIYGNVSVVETGSEEYEDAFAIFGRTVEEKPLVATFVLCITPMHFEFVDESLAAEGVDVRQQLNTEARRRRWEEGVSFAMEAEARAEAVREALAEKASAEEAEEPLEDEVEEGAPSTPDAKETSEEEDWRAALAEAEAEDARESGGERFSFVRPRTINEDDVEELEDEAYLDGIADDGDYDEEDDELEVPKHARTKKKGGFFGSGIGKGLGRILGLGPDVREVEQEVADDEPELSGGEWRDLLRDEVEDDEDELTGADEELSEEEAEDDGELLDDEELAGSEEEDELIPGGDEEDDELIPGSDEEEDEPIPGSDEEDDELIPGSDEEEDELIPGSAEEEDELIPGAADVEIGLGKLSEEVLPLSDEEDVIIPGSDDVELVIRHSEEEVLPVSDDEDLIIPGTDDETVVTGEGARDLASILSDMDDDEVGVTLDYPWEEAGLEPPTEAAEAEASLDKAEAGAAVEEAGAEASAEDGRAEGSGEAVGAEPSAAEDKESAQSAEAVPEIRMHYTSDTIDEAFDISEWSPEDEDEELTDVEEEGVSDAWDAPEAAPVDALTGADGKKTKSWLERLENEEELDDWEELSDETDSESPDAEASLEEVSDDQASDEEEGDDETSDEEWDDEDSDEEWDDEDSEDEEWDGEDSDEEWDDEDSDEEQDDDLSDGEEDYDAEVEEDEDWEEESGSAGAGEGEESESAGTDEGEDVTGTGESEDGLTGAAGGEEVESSETDGDFADEESLRGAGGQETADDGEGRTGRAEGHEDLEEASALREDGEEGSGRPEGEQVKASVKAAESDAEKAYDEMEALGEFDDLGDYDDLDNYGDLDDYDDLDDADDDFDSADDSDLTDEYDLDESDSEDDADEGDEFDLDDEDAWDDEDDGDDEDGPALEDTDDSEEDGSSGSDDAEDEEDQSGDGDDFDLDDLDDLDDEDAAERIRRNAATLLEEAEEIVLAEGRSRKKKKGGIGAFFKGLFSIDSDDEDDE